MLCFGNVFFYEKFYYISLLYGGKGGGGLLYCIELDMIRLNVYKWICFSYLILFIKICIKIDGELYNYILELF